MKQIIYRDSKTGWFVKKSTWTRSKARNSTRYKRQRIEVKKREGIKRTPIPPEPPEEEEEIQGGFDSA